MGQDASANRKGKNETASANRKGTNETASANRKGTNETASAKDKNFVHLANACSWWKDFKSFLTKLQAKEILSMDDYIEAFKENDPFKEAKHLSNLKVVCQHSPVSPVNEKLFIEELLPWLAGKALAVEQLFTENRNQGLLKKLKKFKSGKITLTRQQVCTLMALSFFNAFDVQGSPCPYNHFSFLNILSIKTHSQQSKTLCLLQYFSRLMAAENDGDDLSKIKLSFERLVLKEAPDWSNCNLQLGPLLSHEELIEENHAALQVDFANKFIGGGVLQLGNVQEEIRFVISPECLVSLPLCEEMEPHEAILITGAERFSAYSGYGNLFNYTGPFIDPNPIDDEGRKYVNIVAMDAIVADDDEFSPQMIERDINKAYVAFSANTSMDKADEKSPVASGNWGCGAFGGNKELKTLIQWLAASMAGRPLHYHMFGSPQLAKEQQEIVKLLHDKSCTVGELYKCVIKMDGTKDPFSVIRETFSN